jgi:hypothetical protein
MKTGQQLSTGKDRRILLSMLVQQEKETMFEGSSGSRGRDPVAKLTNPFIAALLQFKQRPSRAPPPGCRGRPRTAMIPLGYDPSSPLDRLSPFCCDERLVYDVAIPILQALLTGDRRIVKTLKEAIKEADHIFRRDREPVLLRQALEYALGEGRGLDVEEFKRNLEARVNHGKPFRQHRWTRVSKRLGLPKRTTGAAAASYQRKP